MSPDNSSRSSCGSSHGSSSRCHHRSCSSPSSCSRRRCSNSRRLYWRG